QTLEDVLGRVAYHPSAAAIEQSPQPRQQSPRRPRRPPRRVAQATAFRYTARSDHGSRAEALMKQVVMLVAVLACARAAAGQNADDYRGGWRTDSGEAHTYEFSIRGATVRGVYCTYCADATTLAFVDGTFGPDGIRFEVTHVKADGSTAYKDKALAKFSQGRLIVTGTSGAPGGGTFERVLIKDPHGPDPIPVMVTVLPKGRPAVPGNPQRRNPDGADGLPY